MQPVPEAKRVGCVTKKLRHSMEFALQGLPDKPLTWVGSIWSLYK